MSENAQETQRHSELLKEFTDDLTVLHIPFQYLEANEEQPISSLIIEMPEAEGEANRHLSLAIIPTDESILEIDLIQLYQDLSDEIPQITPQQVTEINNTAFMGHLGIVSETQDVYYRHIWPIPRSIPITPSVLSETLALFNYAAQLAIEAYRQ